MKHTLLYFSLIVGSIAFSQTAIISNKNHSGNLSEIGLESDNFGEGPQQMNHHRLPNNFIFPEMIYRIDDHCYSYYHYNKDSIIQIDTLCNERYFERNGYTIESMKARYGEEIQIHGFSTHKEEIKKDKPLDDSNFWINGSPFQNGSTGLFGLILLSYLLYLISPIFKKR